RHAVERELERSAQAEQASAQDVIGRPRVRVEDGRVPELGAGEKAEAAEAGSGRLEDGDVRVEEVAAGWRCGDDDVARRRERVPRCLACTARTRLARLVG